jgi:hypothetical protein
VVLPLSREFPEPIFRPSISTDGHELFFNFQRASGDRNLELWVAWRFSLDKPFTREQSRPLSEVNSQYNDFAPVIHEDGKTLFWTGWIQDSHDGGPDFHSSSIWIATRAEAFDHRTHTKSPPFGNVRKLSMIPYTPVYNVAVPTAWPEDGARIYFVSCLPSLCSQLGSVFDMYSAVWRSAPTPGVSLAVEPATGVAPLEVCATAEITTPLDTSADSITFDFGDGSPPVAGTETETRARHKYRGPGIFTATVKASAPLPSGQTWTASASQPITAGCPSGDTGRWTASEIGTVRLPGGSRIDGGCLELCAAGRGVLSSRDSLHFVHQEVEGDAVITARVASFTGATGARVGVMVRDSLADDAALAAVLLSLNPGQPGATRLLVRASAGTRLLPAVNGPVLAAPDAWLRLERRGDRLRASWSTDGANWTLLEDFPLALPPRVHMGIALDGADRGTSPFFAAQARVCNLELVPVAAKPSFRRGDTDSNGSLELTDAIALLNYLFLGTSRPECLDAGDFGDDGTADISDAIASLGYQFLGGPAPAPPGPTDCGVDPIEEAPDLGCEKGC